MTKKPAMIGKRAVENVNWLNIGGRLGGLLKHPQVSCAPGGFTFNVVFGPRNL